MRLTTFLLAAALATPVFANSPVTSPLPRLSLSNSVETSPISPTRRNADADRVLASLAAADKRAKQGSPLPPPLSAPISMPSQQEEDDLPQAIGELKLVYGAIRPVAYVDIGEDAYVLVQDGHNFTRYRAGRTYGKIKVTKISEDGLTFLIGKTSYFASIAYASEAAPQAKAGGRR